MTLQSATQKLKTTATTKRAMVMQEPKTIKMIMFALKSVKSTRRHSNRTDIAHGKFTGFVRKPQNVRKFPEIWCQIIKSKE